jgi:hypothetical protein
MDRRDLLRAVAAAIVGGALPNPPPYVPCERVALDPPSIGPLWNACDSDPLEDVRCAIRRIEQESLRPYRPPVVYLNRAHRDYILQHWNVDVADEAAREELRRELAQFRGVDLAYVS